MPRDAAYPSAIALPTERKALAVALFVEIPGAPEYTDEYEDYLRHPPFEGEDWEAFRRRVDALTAEATAAVDPCIPLWNAYTTPVADDAGIAAVVVTGALERAMAKARGWMAAGGGTLALQVGERVARVGIAAGLIPRPQQSDDTTVFAWASTRMVFTAHGFEAWPTVCSWFAGTECPWSSDETAEEWAANNREAHRASGVAQQAMVMRLSDLRGFPALSEDDLVPKWLEWWALGRVLTHVRREGADRKDVVLRVLYGNRVDQLDYMGGSAIGSNKALVRDVCERLKCGAGTGQLIKYALAKLSLHDLLYSVPVSELPGTVLASPLAHLVTDPEGVGWSEAGLGLSGVWAAADGRVTPTTGDEADALMFRWAVAPPDAGDAGRADARFRASIPATYDCSAWPSEIVRRMMPNVMNGIDWDVLVDAMVVAHVLGLSDMWPIIWCLPMDPTAEGSTNNGKTTLENLLLRAFVPGHEGARKWSGGGGAPDMRAGAIALTKYGTCGIDEFVMPKDPSSLFHYENLNSLTVGIGVEYGLVRSNDQHTARLRSPMLIGAKTVELQPDMMSRSLFTWLRVLSSTERESYATVQELESGRAAVAMRLAGIGWAERALAEGWVDALPLLGGAKHWKYHSICQLAALIAVRRGLVEGADQCTSTIEALRLGQRWVDAALVRQVQSFADWKAKDDASAAGDADVRMPLADVFEEWTPEECQQMTRMWQSDKRWVRAGEASYARGVAWVDALRTRGGMDGQAAFLVVRRWIREMRGTGLSDRRVWSLMDAELVRFCRPPADGDGETWAELPGIAGSCGWGLSCRIVAPGRAGGGLVAAWGLVRRSLG